MDIKAKITIFDADTGLTFVNNLLLNPNDVRESFEFDCNDIYHFEFNFCKFNQHRFEYIKAKRGDEDEENQIL